MADSVLSVRNVAHHYDETEVYRELSLEVQRGEFLCILGPSGCGKSTLLGLLSGALRPTSGEINVRGICRTVYQQDGLFPWLTVRGNIACSVEHLPKNERPTKIEHWIKLVGLEGFADHFPHELSGGMRQRAQLARVLSGDADVLLMDEPFSALDYQTRHRMRGELKRALEFRPSTVVFVTHDVDEAVSLGDRIILLGSRPATIQKVYAVPRGGDPAAVRNEAGLIVNEIIGHLGLHAPASARPV